MIFERIISTALICLLFNPVQVHTSSSESSTSTELPWGLSTRQGRRNTMEDTHAAITSLAGNPNQSFFAIYDGHVGIEAAQAVSEGLYTVKALHETLAECTEWSSAMRLRGAFLQTEQALLSQDHSEKFGYRQGYCTGTTAVTALIDRHTSELTIAWAGDSRAAIVQDDTIIATVDHKPYFDKELERIKKAGGSVFCRYIGTRSRPCELAVSRALGNPQLKPRTALVPVRGLIADPEIGTIPLSEKKNAFLILACDGIWDVFSNQEAAQLVAQTLNSALAHPKSRHAHRKKHSHRSKKAGKSTTVMFGAQALRDATEKEDGNSRIAVLAARILRDAAYAKGSTDNLSVLVVLLNKLPDIPFATEFLEEKSLRSIDTAIGIQETITTEPAAQSEA